MRILLIEDDVLIGDGLFVGLGKLGFTVDWFKDGINGFEAIFQAPYEAIILDLGLPGEDGLSVLKKWRNQGRQEPVIILTARGDIDQRVIGLDNGADDYLAKPFALAEVAARLKALIRRNHKEIKPNISYGNLDFNPQTRILCYLGKPVNLAPKEVLLIELLLLNKNKVLSKTAIEERIYSWDEEVQSNAIEVHIHHLRKKIDKKVIQTINKIGYTIGEV